MSDEDRKFIRDGCGANAAAYAIGALEAAEAEAFERHLVGCSPCAEDIIAFQAVADALATSVPQHRIPSRVRRRVMTDVRAERRQDAAARPRELWPPRLIAGRVRVVGTALGAGLALVLVATVLLLSGGSHGSRVITARVVDSPGSAQVRLSDGRAELVVRHLPPPPAGRVYEVWLKRPGRALAPTRVLFGVTAQGAGDVGVPEQLGGVSEILVTSEPAGGSLVPTHAPVIIARLS